MHDKKYIYTMYIYRKCDDLCKKWSLSYGYPMVILWVSYGIVSFRPRSALVPLPFPV